ncbi:MAG: hypothetical protein DRP64_16915, partial [Verrucomicrobia bacterium]
ISGWSTRQSGSGSSGAGTAIAGHGEQVRPLEVRADSLEQVEDIKRATDAQRVLMCSERGRFLT